MGRTVCAAVAVDPDLVFAAAVDPFGTGEPARAEPFVREKFDFRPGMIVRKLGLLKPIYRQTTNDGHFGKPELTWEK